MPKHAPGPWRMVDRMDAQNKSCGISIWGQKEHRIYYRKHEEVKICSIPDGATVYGGHAWPEQHANARPIKAAPDMLHALRYAIEGVECNCGGPCRGTCSKAVMQAALDKVGD
jgi:hypothetical protein